jgi:hypothetical protein
LGTGSVWLGLEQALYDGLGGLEVAVSSGKCGVIKCVIALVDKEPEMRVKGRGPIRLQWKTDLVISLWKLASILEQHLLQRRPVTQQKRRPFLFLGRKRCETLLPFFF